MATAEALLEQGKAINLSDPLGALNLFSEALELISEVHNPNLKLTLLLEMSFVHRTMTNVKEGFPLATEALELAKSLEATMEIMKANNFLGIFCFYSGLYKRALGYFYDGLDCSLNWGPERAQISLYINVGETYKALNTYTQASHYFERALMLADTMQMNRYLTPVYCNMGDVSYRNDNLEQAEQYFLLADHYREESADPIYCAELDYKRAMLLKKQSQITEAIELLKSAEVQFRRLNHKFYLIDVLVELAEFNFNVSKAENESNLIEARQIAVEIGAQGKLATIAYKLAMLAEAKGDYQSALEYYKNFHENAARSDAHAILNKLEIMNMDRQHLENSQELDVKDFANLEIFSSTDINKYIDFYHKEMAYKANTDELTGLANRRKINAQLRQIISPNPGRVNAFFLLDIDHFKIVNDSEGHLYGDRCLMRIAKVIREWAYSYGVFVGRYGGEEFLGLAENILLSDIEKMAEDLRERVEKEKILYRIDGKERYITVSIGCAAFAEDDISDMTKRLEQADRSLYMAKSMGRNRVMLLNQRPAFE